MINDSMYILRKECTTSTDRAGYKTIAGCSTVGSATIHMIAHSTLHSHASHLEHEHTEAAATALHHHWSRVRKYSFSHELGGRQYDTLTISILQWYIYTAFLGSSWVIDSRPK